MFEKLIGMLISDLSFLSSSGSASECFKGWLDEEIMPASLIEK